MKILSIRKGFQAEHSSTSYEFLAIDKLLGPAERKAVAALSSRARPTKRKVSFIYHGDFNDLPGGWESLMKKYYDIMYSESYDWWTLATAFPTNQKAITEIKKYDFTGTDDLGIHVDSKGDRVIVSIYCRLRAEMLYDGNYGYDGYDEDEEGEESDVVESNDTLLDLLAQNRKYLIKGDYRLLYGVWKKYGDGHNSKKDAVPQPLQKGKTPKSIEGLLSLLEQTE